MQILGFKNHKFKLFSKSYIIFYISFLNSVEIDHKTVERIKLCSDSVDVLDDLV